MRFFTRSWYMGELDEEEWDRVCADYEEHLKALLPALPETVQAFAQRISIHDARIREIVIDRPRKELTIRLCSGNVQAGYFNLDITYSGIVLETLDITALREAANNPATELLYDEFYLNFLDQVAHSIICSPEHELSVTFKSFHYKVTQQANRRPRRRAPVREPS